MKLELGKTYIEGYDYTEKVNEKGEVVAPGGSRSFDKPIEISKKEEIDKEMDRHEEWVQEQKEKAVPKEYTRIAKKWLSRPVHRGVKVEEK